MSANTNAEEAATDAAATSAAAAATGSAGTSAAPAETAAAGAAGGTGAAAAAAAAAAECQGCGVSEANSNNRFLSCPRCVELNIHPNTFCSQECFRQSWKKHKVIHDVIQSINKQKQKKQLSVHPIDASNYNPHNTDAWINDPHLSRFVGYRFSGSLRPWPITPQVSVPPTIPAPDYAESGVPISEQSLRHNAIKVHTQEEIERLRGASALGRAALDLANKMIRVGVTADQIDKAVHSFIVQSSAYPSPLNYQHFPKSCCISVNETICHGIPDLRPLEEGDIVNVDITVYYKGMHADLNETFCCGTPNADQHRLLQGSYVCLMEAIKACKPGMMYREIGRVVSSFADKYGLSVVRSYCGHGIGELFHTSPSIPHYRNNKAVGVMKPGHVFTIEPMLCLGRAADTLWPDGWTAVTADGSLSAQFEHTLCCTDTGVEILTKRNPNSPKLPFDTLGFDYP